LSRTGAALKPRDLSSANFDDVPGAQVAFDFLGCERPGCPKFKGKHQRKKGQTLVENW